MIYDVLPSTSLRAEDIRDTIGIPSNNLSHYIVKAKSGGKGGYAWNIKENGGVRSDGTLITDAEPYFNIYSPKSPAEWVLVNSQTSIFGKEFQCRLRRHKGEAISIGLETIDNSCYAFDLGQFAGYRHNAGPVLIYGPDKQYINIDNPDDGAVIYFDPGSISWHNLMGIDPSTLKYGLKVNSGGTYFSNDPNGATGGSVMIKARPHITDPGETDIIATAGLYKSDGTQIGGLPIRPYRIMVEMGHGDLTSDNRRFMGIEFTHTTPTGVTTPLTGVRLLKNPRAWVSQIGYFDIYLEIERSTFPWAPGPQGAGIWADIHTTILMPRPGNDPHIYGVIRSACEITDENYHNGVTINIEGYVPQFSSASAGRYYGVEFRLDIVK